MNRHGRTRIGVAVALAAGIALSHCRDVAPGPDVRGPMSLEIAPDNPSIAVGGTVQLIATVKDGSGHAIPNRVFTWATSDSAVAVVAPSGVATGMSEGSVQVTASSEGMSAHVALTVHVASTAPAEVVVSNPFRAPAAAVTGLGFASSSAGNDSVVFVSMQSGFVPTGASAIVRNLYNGTVISTLVLSGGFDPVMLSARVGDALGVVVRTGSGDTAYTSIFEVRERRPPVIVRSEPPPKKTDVPLNNIIVVIASEPIAATSLSGATLQLFRGTTPVAGSVRFYDSSHVMVQFVPAQQLAVNTAYRLVVTSGLKDLSGDALEETQTVDFTTGTHLTPAPMFLEVTPFGATLLRDIGAVQLTVIARDTMFNLVPAPPVTWESRDPTVATVTSYGLVRARVPGSDSIIVRAGPLSAYALISVVDTTSTRVGGMWDWTEIMSDPGSGTVCSDTGTYVINQVGTVFSGWSDQSGSCARPGEPPYENARSYELYGQVNGGGATFEFLIGSCSYTGQSQAVTATSLSGTVSCGISNGTLTGTWQATSATPVESVTVVPATATLTAGSQIPIRARLFNAAGHRVFGRPVTWGTDNAAAAIVVDSVLAPVYLGPGRTVRAVATGTAHIGATVGGKTATSVVTVTPTPTTVSITPANDTIAADGTVQYTAVVRDELGNAMPQWQVHWSIDNTTVATITQAGLATAVAPGRTIVRAAADNAGSSTELVVSGTPPDVSGDWSFTTDYYYVDYYYSQFICRDFAGVHMTQAGFAVGGSAVHVGDCGIANGSITGEMSGRILTLMQGGCSATLDVTPDLNTIGGSSGCTDGTNGQVTGVRVGAPASVRVEPAAALLIPGDTRQLAAILQDAAGHPIYGHTVTWTSNDLGVATVNASGVVTATGPGSTTITGTVDGLTASAVVIVRSLNLTTISAGRGYSCGVDVEGAALCWGINNTGQLGNSSSIAESQVPVVVSGWGGTYRTVQTRSFFACGLTTAGTAQCWGYNASGQLGDETDFSRNYAQPVAGGFTFATLAEGAAGQDHMCALTTAGAAYCWGSNTAGQLGVGTIYDAAYSPVPVAGGLTFTSLTVGGYHTCGLTSGGTAYCWGLNNQGELGDGTSTLRTVPTAVVGSLTFTKLAAGYTHTCGLVADGSAYCWGENLYGQIGNGGNTNLSEPTAVAGGFRFTSISLGEYTTCAVTAAGAAYCWGSNSAGQLGVGVAGGLRMYPALVAGALSFTDVRLGGGEHACARTGTNVAYCWGDNTWGQLGDRSTTPSPVPVRVAGQP